jgi:hypothetical protein
MRHGITALALALSTGFACAQQAVQQSQVDSRYILGPLQAQRDRAANEAALCGAENAKLNEEMAASKAKIAELEKKLADLDK